MYRCVLFAFLLLAGIFTTTEEFGYITYSTSNIGDYVQALAARRFLPQETIGIDREHIAMYMHPRKIPTIVNGWYMHAANIDWPWSNIAPPTKSWPPAPCIDPLLISMHITSQFSRLVSSPESVDYLRNHGPVGARDFHTLHLLQNLHIPVYFSGCLTLTLDNPYKNLPREEIIYVSDISPRCFAALTKRAQCKVVCVNHIDPEIARLPEAQKMERVDRFYDQYRRAKCVITTRLHAALPCLAFGTPVLFINPTGPRLTGNAELLHWCSEADFINGLYPYDVNNPPQNKEDYLPIRENLIKTITTWVNTHRQNAALVGG